MMKKNKWVYLTLGALAVALFLAYRKRNVPKPDDERMSTEDENQFIGMSGKKYIKPTNLIPDIYGRTRGYVNADGTPCDRIDMEDIYSVCRCSAKNKVRPTILANFR